MAGMFTVKVPDVKKLFRQIDKVFNQSIAASLNDAAFELRKQALNVFNENIIIRSPAFVKRQLRVARAKASDGIANMKAEAGSVAAPGFTGWKEQLGAPDARKKTITLAARGGNKKNIVAPKNRFQPKAHYPSSKNYPGLPPNQAVAAAIDRVKRAGGQGKVVLEGAGFPLGLYAVDGERVGALQLFDRPPAETTRLSWIEEGLSGISDDFIQRAFVKNANYYAKKMMSKK